VRINSASLRKFLFHTVRIVENIFPFLILTLVVNLFVIYFVSQEKYIYFWDYSGYWIMERDFLANLKHDPLHAFNTLIYSIRHEDYNMLPVLFLVPFNSLFGSGRLPFILSIVNTYAVPAILMLFLIIREILLRYYNIQSFFLPFISIISVALFPQFWIPILSGLPDVVGVLIIFWIILIYLKKPYEKQTISSLLGTSFLLFVLIMMRRWYAYWVVCFFIVIVLRSLIINLKEYGFKTMKYSWTPFKNIVLSGIILVIIMFSFVTPIAMRMLVTNYADIYSVYKTSDSVIRAFQYLGTLLFLFFSLGVVQTAIKKKTRQIALLLLSHFIITFLLFSRTQNFGPQHFYLIIPTILIFVSLFFVNSFLYLKTTLYKSLLSVGYLGIFAINFACVFVPNASGHLGNLESLFTYARHYPLIRNDTEEIGNLINVLKSLTKTGDDSVYVLSSSYTLNEETLKNACISLNQDNCDNALRVLRVSHVDKRDGFPEQLLDARYVLVGDPIQYHLRPNDQKVIGVPADLITRQESIGSAFDKLPYEFMLENNVKVYIYKKRRPFKSADLDELSQLFITLYPDKRDIFKISNNSCDIYDEAPQDIAKAVEVNYGNNIIKLIGLTIKKPLRTQLEISYYWKITGQIDSYISFVHFTDIDNNILFQNDHHFCQKLSFEDLKGKFIKETYVLNIPQSALHKEVDVKIGVFSPLLKSDQRLKIELNGDTLMDNGNTRAIIDKLKL